MINNEKTDKYISEMQEYIKRLKEMPHEEAKIESKNNLLHAGIIDINGDTIKEYINN